jgi:lantibiotic transport system ATP-binding protein
VGSLIDSPSFYAHLSATENLKILQKIYACPKERISVVLEIVGLSHVGKKKVSQFSLGMKQRLSIAIALLHDPALLILDEPTNGLDPNGIIEMRELLKRLNQENGITILVSSHLLAEIEKIITHLAIIDKGKVVFQGTYNELKQLKQKGNSLIIQTSNLPKSLEIVQLQGFGEARIIEDHILIEQIEKEQVAQLNRLFVSNGMAVFQLAHQEFSLESIFIHLTN